MQQQALAQQAAQVQQNVDPMNSMMMQQGIARMANGLYNLPGTRVSTLGQNGVSPAVLNGQMPSLGFHEFNSQAPQVGVSPQQPSQIPQTQASSLKEAPQAPKQQVPQQQQQMMTSQNSGNPNFRGGFSQVPIMIHPVPQFNNQYKNEIVPISSTNYGF